MSDLMFDWVAAGWALACSGISGSVAWALASGREQSRASQQLRDFIDSTRRESELRHEANQREMGQMRQTFEESIARLEKTLVGDIDELKKDVHDLKTEKNDAHTRLESKIERVNDKVDMMQAGRDPTLKPR